MSRGAMTELSWKPVSIGKTYCAPACGRGCTLDEFSRATKQADNLARKLGAGWVPKVWENLGWHWAIERGGLKLHPGLAGGYTAFLGEANSVGGRWAEHGRTPQEAIRNVIGRAKLELADVIAILKSAAA